jgi:ABC-type nitrate/sulfonate/bicarbonate transport system substrate-binding protein
MARIPESRKPEDSLKTMRCRRALKIVAILFGIFLVPRIPASAEATETAAPVPIRIGWQVPAVAQAGIVQVLKRTDILASHGLEPILVPFSFGTPENEAAFAGELDAIFTGDQPAINLVAMGGRWHIVARLNYDRTAIIVPPGSPIQEVADLAGMTVAIPFGSIAHREAFVAQQRADLDPDTDVVNLDLDILEIRRRVLNGGVETWGEIDAAGVWEPDLSTLEIKGMARLLNESLSADVVALSDEFVARNPEAAVQFLVALTRAWYFFARDPDQVMSWYSDDSQLDYEHEALMGAVRLDPNINARSLQDIDLELSAELITILEEHAAWGLDDWPDGSRIRQYVDQDLLTRARQEVATKQFEQPRIILPSVREVASNNTGDWLPLDALPLWAVFSFMVLVALLAIELGFRFGLHSRDEKSYESGRPLGTVGSAVLGMMAFVIALTFNSATNRFDDRKAALLEDVTTIRTAYLQTSLLPEPHRTILQSLLRDYVQARVGMVQAYGQPERLDLIERRARTLQDLMWSHIEDMVDEYGRSGTHASYASVLSNVFNQHTKRVVLGAYYRIPGFMWWAIIFASAVAMAAVGLQFGMAGGRRVPAASLALALTFALVMMLAFDLDRAGEGPISVNQKPMMELYQSMSARR